MNLLLFSDGGSRGNPGPAGAGVVILDQQTSQPIHEAGYYLGRITNNVAEYQGLIRGLEVAAHLAPRRLDVRLDSELLVRQVQGQYKVKSPNLKPLHEKAMSLLAGLGEWSIDHVYRNDNARADELANMAMDRKADVIVRSSGGTVSEADQQALADAELPRWRAEFRTDPGPKCPAGCRKGQKFELAAATPAGLCIHAAGRILNECLAQTEAQGPEGASLQCPRCRATISLRPG